MKHLIKYAKELGYSYATLVASADAGFNIYKKLGFKTVGLFECYERLGSSI